MSDLTYVSFDPGASRVKKTIGTVLWDELGNCIDMREYDLEDLYRFLSNCEKSMTLTTFIVEGYRIFAHMAKEHIGDPMLTSQCIGTIKYAAWRMELKLIEQPSKILGVAQLHSGFKIPKDHDKSHIPSAYNHGYYYLTNINVIKPRVLERLKNATIPKPRETP